MSGSIRVALMLSLVGPSLCLAHDGPAFVRKPTGPQGKTYAELSQLPKLPGVWSMDRWSLSQLGAISEHPDSGIVPFTAPWLQKHRDNLKARLAGDITGNNSADCTPTGMPAVMSTYRGYEFLYTPGRVTIITENGELRRIDTSGADHPADPDTSFEGHSVGYWDQGTLVVDTIAINPRAELFVGMHVEKNIRVVERMHLTAPDTLQVDTTVYDDSMFTKPYSYKRIFTGNRVWAPSYCTENNRDVNTHVDLTPPAD